MKKVLIFLLFVALALIMASCHVAEKNGTENNDKPDSWNEYVFVNDTERDCRITWYYEYSQVDDHGVHDKITATKTVQIEVGKSYQEGGRYQDSLLYMAPEITFFFDDADPYDVENSGIKPYSMPRNWWDLLSDTKSEIVSQRPIVSRSTFYLSDVWAIMVLEEE
jgi:hypothetical protein